MEKLAVSPSGKDAALLQRPLLVSVVPDECLGRCGRVLLRALLEPGSPCWLGHFKFVTLPCPSALISRMGIIVPATQVCLWGLNAFCEGLEQPPTHTVGPGVSELLPLSLLN